MTFPVSRRLGNLHRWRRSNGQMPIRSASVERMIFAVAMLESE